MSQCKKTNADGTRCSNRAVHGSDFCNEHRERTKFVRKPTAVPQEKPARPLSMAPAQDERQVKDAGSPQVQPSTRSDAPRIAGLRRDVRGVLVGQQAIVRLARAERLTQLLSGLSGEMELTRAELRRHPEHGSVVLVQAPDPQADDLSSFYDRIAGPARLAEAEFSIGAQDVFVPYRDHEAPFGYDLHGNPGPKNDRIRLFGFGGLIEIAWQGLPPIPIRDVVLEAAAAPRRRQAETSGRIFVLTVCELQNTFCRYFRSHHLAYRLGRIGVGKPTCVLFDVEATAAPAVVPAFVIAYLRSFPRTVVLGEVFEADRRRVLVEMGCAMPWTWANTVGLFAEDCLLAITGVRDFPNLCLEPAPKLVDGDALVSLRPKELPPLKAAPLEKVKLPSCRFEIRFHRDNGPATRPVALLLSDSELTWLRRLLYKLPAGEFSHYQVLHGSPYSVLLGDQVSIRDLPFGVPMKRVLDSGLLIPCHLKLVPDLPLSLLAEALKVDLAAITLITEEVRLEIARTSFAPLSSLLCSGLNREPVELELHAPRTLPDLKWTMPEGLDQLEPLSGPAARAALADIPPEALAALRSRGGNADEIEVAAAMKTRAGDLRTGHDYLGAALYYALAGDLGASADLFRRQAERLRQGD